MAAALNAQDCAYVIGSLAVLVEWRAYWLHSGKSFRRWSASGAILWTAQYFLLGAWTAGLTMASSAFRTLISGWLENRMYKHGAAIGFVLLFAGLTTLSWQGWISLLPAIAVINTTLALFFLDNRTMRIAMLASSLAWLSNDVYWQAWPSLVAESVAMAINLRTIRLLFATNHNSN